MAQISYHCGNFGATVLAYVIQPWVKKVFFSLISTSWKIAVDN